MQKRKASDKQPMENILSSNSLRPDNVNSPWDLSPPLFSKPCFRHVC